MVNSRAIQSLEDPEKRFLVFGVQQYQLTKFNS